MFSINKLFNLKERTAVITGANGHLGKKICITLAEMKANLILVSRNKKTNDNLVKELINKYPNLKIKGYICDLSKEKSRNLLLKKINKSKINILINNATYSNSLTGYADKFEKQSIKKWRESFEINLTAAFHLVMGLNKNLKRSGNGTIINVSSIYGIYAPDWKMYKGTNMGNSAAYSAAKGGLIQLTKWLSTTLAPFVRVNSISPGGILRGQPKKFIHSYKKKTPLKRMAKEEDLIGAFAFLASDASNYITGQNIIVDGGWGN